MFELVENSIETELVGFCNVSPSRLVEVFGPPNPDDGFRVSGAYTFVNVDKGESFSLYDWKATNLYEDDEFSQESAPYPKEFWSSTDSYTFHLGGNEDTNVSDIKLAIEAIERGDEVAYSRFFKIPSGK